MKLSTARLWLPVALVIINAYGVYCLHDLRRTRGRERNAVRFSAGHDGIVSGGTELTWHFPAPATPEATVGEWTRQGLFEITPEVPGRFGWRDTRTLTFRPESDWPTCVSFMATPVPGRVRHLALPRPLPTFHFATPSLTLRAMTHAGQTRRGGARLRLEFNAAPDVATLTEALKVWTLADQTLGWELVAGPEHRVVRIETEPTDAERLRVTLAATLKPQRGDRGLAAEIDQRVLLDAALRIQRVDAHCDGFDPPYIQVQFSSDIDPEAAADFISVDPPLTLRVSRLYRWYENRCWVNGDFEPGRRYRLTFREGLPGEGEQQLARTITRSVQIPNRNAHLSFRAPGRYLSSAGGLTLPLTSVNVPRVTMTAERLYANNLAFYALRDAGLLEGDRAKWYGAAHDRLTRQTGEMAIDTRGAVDQMHDTPVELRPLLGAEPSGAFLIRASAPDTADVQRLVIVSDLGLTLKQTRDAAWVRVVTLLGARPVANAAIQAYTDRNQLAAEGVTDARGLARLPLDLAGKEQLLLVTARHGADMTYLALDRSRTALPGEQAGDPYASQPLQAHCFAERGAYRPGETAHVRLIVRGEDLSAPPPFPLELRVLKPDGRELRRIPLMLSALGTATTDLIWPLDTPTGRYQLLTYLPGEETPLTSCHALVETFAPPRIAVDALPGTSHTAGQVRFDVAARHLFGRAAEGLRCRSQVTFSSAPFEPDAWPEYHFGDDRRPTTRHTHRFGEYLLNEEGQVTLYADWPDDARPAAALSAAFEASVIEPSGRAVSAHARQLVHPYPRYIGLRARQGRTVVSPGVPHPVQIVLVRPDGERDTLPPQPLELQVLHEQWQTVLKQEGDHYRYVSERILQPVSETTLALTDAGAQYDFVAPHAGRFMIAVRDPDGGMASTLSLTSAGPDDTWIDRSQSEPDRIDLSLDRTSYAPGDVAEVLIKAPFAGEALLTLETDTVLDARTFTLTGNTQRVTIPIPATAPPSLHAVVSVVRPLPRGEMLPVCRAVGSVALAVARPAHALTVALRAPGAVRPDAPAIVEIEVRNAAGEPAQAEICLAAVDEGICRLTDYTTPDTLAYFRRARCLGVAMYDLYSHLLPELGKRVDGHASQIGGGGVGGLSQRLNPISGERFRPVALWQGPLQSDSNGIVRLTLDVPEFAGTLRLMATAVSADAFGTAEHAMVVSRPLLATPALPRFLAPGDQCDMSVTLFNQTEQAIDARCRPTASGPVTLSWARDRIRVPAKGQARLVGQLQAGDTTGICTMRLDIASAEESFQLTTELPVRPPVGLREQGDVGRLLPGETADIEIPAAWLPGTGRYTLTCAGHLSVQLSRSLTMLLRYPYGCLEQTTSSAFPLLYLDALMARPETADETPVADAGFVQAGIERILGMQRGDGGFDYWPRSGQRYSWGSVYATHFLVEARHAGHQVPESELNAALEALSSGLVDRDGGDDAPERNTSIYACYVLSLAGRAPQGWIRRFVELEAELSLSARVHLVAALAAAGERGTARDLARRLPVPQLKTLPREFDGALVSPVRETAVLLRAWLDIDTDAPEVQQLARALMQAMNGGRWGSTQENAVALMALGRYARLQRHSEVHGQLTTTGGKGGSVSTSHAIATMTSWTHRGELDTHPMRLALTNTGDAPCFFQWTARGVPLAWDTQRISRGVAVKRIWRTEQGDLLQPQTPVPQGALIEVTLEVAPQERTLDNLVIEDLLPAGFEIENPNLKSSADTQQTPESNPLPIRHVERRDDRLLLFPRQITHPCSYTYALRAVTPGTYVRPPIAAECMYDASIRAEGPSVSVTVLAAGE